MKRNELLALLLFLAALVAQVAKGGIAWPVIVPSGPIHTKIVREAGDTDKDYGALWVALRQGEAAAHFSEGGRRLTILDDDATDEHGKQVIPATDLQGVTLPAALFYSETKLVGKESIPKGTTAQAFIAIAGRHGG